MYVIYPADEVVTQTYISQSLPRPRQRPTLDIIFGPPLAPPSAHPPPRVPTLTCDKTHLKTAPPELAERAPASPTPSLERPKLRERTKAKLLKKLGRHEDHEFGKIVRTPAPDEFELPAPLPTPAFSRKNIFDRNFDALFEVANSPQFGAHIRVTTPEPDRQSDLSAAHFPSQNESSLSLLPPRPHSEPSSTPPTSARTSTPSTPTQQRSSFEGSTPNSKSKKVSFFRKVSRTKEATQPRSTNMQQQPSVEMALRELNHPLHNEQLKNQQQVTFKLVKTAVATIHKYYEHYQENTIRFTTRTDYLDWNTTFPSISVCEVVNIDKIWLDNTGFSELKGGKFDRFLAEIIFYTGTCYSCLTSCTNESACRINYAELTKNVRTSCEKMFINCSWNGKPIKCCNYFKPLQTEYGTCYSINNKHAKRKQRMLYTSAHAKQSQSINGVLEITVSQDYEVFMHSPEDIPFWNMEYDRRVTVLYGSEATVIFSIMDVVNEPEVSLIAPEIRQCRFSHEVPENYIAFKQYSYSVCIIQCRIETQLNLCNCTHHLSPAKYKNRYCDLEGLKCLTRYHRILRKLQVPGRNEIGLNCDCLPSCTEPDYNVIRKKLLQPEKVLNVRPTTFILGNMPYERITRQVARTTLDLVVAMGNCFGLCFGGSLLSIVEIVYYLCFRRWKKT